MANVIVYSFKGYDTRQAWRRIASREGYARENSKD